MLAILYCLKININQTIDDMRQKKIQKHVDDINISNTFMTILSFGSRSLVISSRMRYIPKTARPSLLVYKTTYNLID